MARTIDQFCDLWLRSRLHTTPKVHAVRARWQAVAVRPDGLAEFAAWLTANNHLTEYHVKHLLEGHADNFFIPDRPGVWGGAQL